MLTFDVVRDDLLLTLPPTGWEGFEGLMAAVLADLAGEPIYLAKAGWQAGLDGRSNPSAASIAFEAKRYGAGRSIDDRSLLGELEELGHDAQFRPEIWLVAASVPITAQTRTKIVRSARAKGIHVPIVDWSPPEMPALVAFLASAKESVVAWLDRHHPGHSARAILRDILDGVAGQPSFSRQRKQLIQEVLPPYASFVLAKKAVGQAYSNGFKDRNEARRLFRQKLTPDAIGVVNLRRVEMLKQIKDAADIASQRQGIVVLLGDEGVGKTWAAVQAWRESFSDSLCALFSAGHIESFQNASPVYGIAHIIRSATASYDINNGSWEVRVSHWKSTPRPDRRLYVIVDGLNERPSVSWTEFIPAMRQLVHEIGGTIVLTCRPRFWTSRIAGGLDESVEVVRVGVLDESEVQEFLSRHKRSTIDIPSAMLVHLRNPRVLTVAVELLDELGGDDLTLDRLYWAYWKHHWRERPNNTLSDDEFREVLVNHAKQVKIELDRHGEAAVEGTRFYLSRWMEHAAVGSRVDKKSLADLFWEVVDGRFLALSESGASEAYVFRSEALNFAIALRLVYEVLDDPSVIKDSANADQVLDRAIEPIEAFDRTAEISVAVVAIAALHPRSNIALQEAAIRSFLSLQNRGPESEDDFCAYIREAPEAYLSVCEAMIKRREGPPQAMLRALRAGLNRADARAKIERSMAGWSSANPLGSPIDPVAASWAVQILSGSH